jgi:2'-5' RNA ligase
MIRLFLAIVLPAAVKERMTMLAGGVPGAKWIDRENMHLTLRFIGEVERPVAEDLAAALARVTVPPFDLRIRGTGRFEQRNGGALWAAVEPKEPVAALAAKVERACQSVGLEPERRAFPAHITLARWKGRRTREVGEWLERNRTLSSPPFTVTEFVLFESRLSRHGALYQPVVDYTLRKVRTAPRVVKSEAGDKSAFLALELLFGEQAFVAQFGKTPDLVDRFSRGRRLCRHLPLPQDVRDRRSELLLLDRFLDKDRCRCPILELVRVTGDEDHRNVAVLADVLHRPHPVARQKPDIGRDQVDVLRLCADDCRIFRAREAERLEPQRLEHIGQRLADQIFVFDNECVHVIGSCRAIP